MTYPVFGKYLAGKNVFPLRNCWSISGGTWATFACIHNILTTCFTFDMGRILMSVPCSIVVGAERCPLSDDGTILKLSLVKSNC